MAFLQNFLFMLFFQFTSTTLQCKTNSTSRLPFPQPPLPSSHSPPFALLYAPSPLPLPSPSSPTPSPSPSPTTSPSPSPSPTPSPSPSPTTSPSPSPSPSPTTSPSPSPSPIPSPSPSPTQSPSPTTSPSPSPSPTPSPSPSPSPTPSPSPSPSLPPSPPPLEELGRVLVSKDGSGNFSTITDAINFAPNNSNNGYFVIHVNEGIYEEYITIPRNKSFLLMEGDGMNKTIISGNRSVTDGWNTTSTATFTVQGNGFVAKNITFSNTAGSAKQQAVAVLNQADQSTFYKCAFEGYQDTLFVKIFRQFYRDCKIYGTLDFIFGNAAAVFQNCEIYVRLPSKGQYNVITAQGRENPTQETGIVIQNCSINATSELTSNTKTYLGRPWKNYSRVIFSQSFMEDIIDPLGWIEMLNKTLSEDTLFYGEFNNIGPGSNTSGRVKWHGYHIMKADQDMMNYTVSNFLNGDEWLPMTGIPYDGGLI